MKKFLLLILFLLAVSLAEAGSVQFSTYYPSPFGMYDRLRLVPRADLGGTCDAATQAGTLYVEEVTGALTYCNISGTWGPLAGGPWTQDGVNDYIYPTETATNPNLKIGIGTTAPQTNLHISGDGEPALLIESASNMSANNPIILADRARGTIASKSAVAAGDTLFEIYARGYDGSGYLNAGAMKIEADGAPTGGYIPTRFQFITAGGGLTEKMRITSDGNVGIGTATPRTRLELGNDGAILATGTFGAGWTEPNLGAGTRLLWYPRKAAFRAGYVAGTQWDDANIGIYSVAIGNNATASGITSVAIGPSATASGYESIAIGDGSTASAALHSAAVGLYTLATGDYSMAIGNSTTAQAFRSTVAGTFNIISGNLTSWVATDPLFVIGNGTDVLNRSNALTVLKNGNVGIGTTSPTYLLDLAKDNRAIVGLSSSTNHSEVILKRTLGTLSAPSLVTNNTTIGKLEYNAWDGTAYQVAANIGAYVDGPSGAGDMPGRLEFATTLDGSTTQQTQMVIKNNGRVGIGTTTPNTVLHVKTSDNTELLKLTSNASAEIILEPQNNPANSYNFSAYDGNFSLNKTGSPSAIRIVGATGRVGIGTDTPTAKLHVNGNIKAVLNNVVGSSMEYNAGSNEIGFDVAELFETSEEVEAGDVLVIDEGAALRLKKSRVPYDTKVAGVVSEAPAILFEGGQLQIAPAPGESGKGTKPPVALSGRVLCKVSAENGAIRPGDLLTSSSVPGHAMKATEREKSFGAIIGKALEPFTEGPEKAAEGRIMILLSLQ